MKQIITEAQYRELSPEIRKILYKQYPDDNPFCAKFYSIGTMIEILESGPLQIYKDFHNHDGSIDKWAVFTPGRYCGDNLCDELWEAVKAIL